MLSRARTTHSALTLHSSTLTYVRLSPAHLPSALRPVTGSQTLSVPAATYRATQARHSRSGISRQHRRSNTTGHSGSAAHRHPSRAGSTSGTSSSHLQLSGSPIAEASIRRSSRHVRIVLVSRPAHPGSRVRTSAPRLAAPGISGTFAVTPLGTSLDTASHPGYPVRPAPEYRSRFRPSGSGPANGSRSEPPDQRRAWVQPTRWRGVRLHCLLQEHAVRGPSKPGRMGESPSGCGDSPKNGPSGGFHTVGTFYQKCLPNVYLQSPPSRYARRKLGNPTSTRNVPTSGNRTTPDSPVHCRSSHLLTASSRTAEMSGSSA